MKAEKNRGMTPAQLHDLSVDELGDKILGLKKEQFNMRFQRASGQLENTSRVREVRRDLARAKTILKQKIAGADKA